MIFKQNHIIIQKIRFFIPIALYLENLVFHIKIMQNKGLP
jgi:hypothetical protein